MLRTREVQFPDPQILIKIIMSDLEKEKRKASQLPFHFCADWGLPVSAYLGVSLQSVYRGLDSPCTDVITACVLFSHFTSFVTFCSVQSTRLDDWASDQRLAVRISQRPMCTPIRESVA